MRILKTFKLNSFLSYFETIASNNIYLMREWKKQKQNKTWKNDDNFTKENWVVIFSFTLNSNQASKWKYKHIDKWERMVPSFWNWNGRTDEWKWAVRNWAHIFIFYIYIRNVYEIFFKNRNHKPKYFLLSLKL